MGNNFFAPRKCFTSENGIENTICYIPSKVVVENHYVVEFQNQGRDFYSVSYPDIDDKEMNIHLLDKDIVSAIFDNQQTCAKHCESLNNFVWDTFVQNCDYDKYQNDIAFINSQLGEGVSHFGENTDYADELVK